MTNRPVASPFVAFSFALVCVSAHAASARVVVPVHDECVRRCVLMAFDAVGFPSVQIRRVSFRQLDDMLAVGYRAEMARTAAQAIFAEMVDFLPIRDWPNERLVGNAMRECIFLPLVTTGDPSIAVGFRAGPQPTPAARLNADFAHQSFGDRDHLFHASNILPSTNNSYTAWWSGMNLAIASQGAF